MVFADAKMTAGVTAPVWGPTIFGCGRWDKESYLETVGVES